MKPYIALSLFLLIFLTFFQSSAQSPNIVFILADDLGYGDLGCYGHRVISTPNLNHLASEGTKFNQFYAPSPLCSPSRAGMLTGRTPFRTGIKSWIPENDNIYLTSKELTIPTLLKNQGYSTFFGGKWHLNGGLENRNHPQPEDHGFDYWMGTHNFTLPTHKDPNNFYRNGKPLGPLTGFAAQIVMDEAIKWVADVSKETPFFMFLSLHEPHSEIASPELFNRQYAEYTAGPIDLEHLSDRGPGEYYANVSHLDHQVGRLLDSLDSLELTENTLIIFTSDNGPVTNQWRYWWEVNMYGETGGLRGRKADLFEGGIRVPCIIKYPGVISPGTESHVPLHGYDLLPTICAITKIPVPQDRSLDGMDFSPIFKGHALERKEPLFWAFNTRQYDDPFGYVYAARKGPWKLITDEHLQKTLLFNLTDDPYEVKELSAQHPDQVRALKRYIAEKVTSILEDTLRPEHSVQSKE